KSRHLESENSTAVAEDEGEKSVKNPSLWIEGKELGTTLGLSGYMTEAVGKRGDWKDVTTIIKGDGGSGGVGGGDPLWEWRSVKKHPRFKIMVAYEVTLKSML
ncbi:unnamed protein product, partial [Ilex paraguariensis]